jgi:hypothetical protein
VICGVVAQTVPGKQVPGAAMQAVPMGVAVSVTIPGGQADENEPPTGWPALLVVDDTFRVPHPAPKKTMIHGKNKRNNNIKKLHCNRKNSIELTMSTQSLMQSQCQL